MTASASGKFNPQYDNFNYALNTTQCPDGTLCPFANNSGCCDRNQSVTEIHYSYNSSAAMPTDVAELTTFYAAAGYTFPTSIPSTSPRPTDLSLAPNNNKLPHLPLQLLPRLAPLHHQQHRLVSAKAPKRESASASR